MISDWLRTIYFKDRTVKYIKSKSLSISHNIRIFRGEGRLGRVFGMRLSLPTTYSERFLLRGFVDSLGRIVEFTDQDPSFSDAREVSFYIEGRKKRKILRLDYDPLIPDAVLENLEVAIVEHNRTI